MERELEGFYKGGTDREQINEAERQLVEMRVVVSEAAEEIAKVKELCNAHDYSGDKAGSVEELEKGNALLRKIAAQLRDLNEKLKKEM